MIRRLLHILLDILLPHGKEAAEIENISYETLVLKMFVRKKHECTVFFSYKDQIIRKMIWAFKYRGKKHIGSMFGDVVYDYLLEEHADSQFFITIDNPLLVPVPLSKKRMRERGYNQVEIIANTILKRDEGELFFDGSGVLKRKESEHQARLEKTDRKENIKNVFMCADVEKIKGRNIILLDDVVTTGTTIREAKKVLMDAGAKNVRCIAVAG